MAILSQPDSLPLAEAIRVAVVLPTHRHSGLLPEALDTALSQQTDFPYAVVIVNDGCPFPETDHVCREFAAAHPGRICYLHTRNHGLSTARNTGIDFALAAFPALDAIYFLDSDNRIRPHLLQRLFDALQRAERTVGWAYPDIDKFGFAEFCDTSGSYSPLEHLFRNVSEAGSMVSRRMLNAGLRFDPAMRQGYEDWEFWLQGLENGFCGVHAQCAGFGYRRRGESMLVDAERDVRPITDHIRAGHPRLFGVKALARLEATVSRRYAIFLPDASALRCVTEPGNLGEEQPLNTFVRRLLRVPERPDYGRCPGHIVVMDFALFDLLATHRLLKGVLWTLERAAAQATVVTCPVALDKRVGLSLAWRGEAILANSHPPPRPYADAQIVTLHTQTLLDLARLHPAHGLEFRREPGKPCHEARLHLQLGIPDPPALRPSAMDGLAALHRALTETWRRDECCGWSAAQFDRFRSHAAMPADIYRDTHGLSSVLPILPTGTGREAALVINPTPCGRALPVTAGLGAWLREHGWGVHLVAIGTGQFAWSPEQHEIFASVIPFPVPLTMTAPPITARDAYLGTPVPCLDPREGADAVGTLAAFDVVVAVQHSLAHTLMGRLRKLQVETWAVLGLADDAVSPADVINTCAAYEHAYQTVIILDVATYRLCRALGIPPEKLRRWGEGGAQADDEWHAIPSLSLSPASVPS
jgi:hypothetical protein